MANKDFFIFFSDQPLKISPDILAYQFHVACSRFLSSDNTCKQLFSISQLNSYLEKKDKKQNKKTLK